MQVLAVALLCKTLSLLCKKISVLLVQRFHVVYECFLLGTIISVRTMRLQESFDAFKLSLVQALTKHLLDIGFREL